MRTVAHPTPQGASCDGVTIPSAARARIMIDRIPAIAGSIITRVRIRTQGVRRSATASTSMVHRHETKRSPVAKFAAPLRTAITSTKSSGSELAPGRRMAPIDACPNTVCSASFSARRVNSQPPQQKPC